MNIYLALSLLFSITPFGWAVFFFIGASLLYIAWEVNGYLHKKFWL